MSKRLVRAGRGAGAARAAGLLPDQPDRHPLRQGRRSPGPCRPRSPGHGRRPRRSREHGRRPRSANGDYIIPFLPPGDYTVTFTLVRLRHGEGDACASPWPEGRSRSTPRMALSDGHGDASPSWRRPPASSTRRPRSPTSFKSGAPAAAAGGPDDAAGRPPDRGCREHRPLRAPCPSRAHVLRERVHGQRRRGAGQPAQHAARPLHRGRAAGDDDHDGRHLRRVRAVLRAGS